MFWADIPALNVTGCGINLSESWMLASFLAGINKIEYNPDAGAGDNLCFKHYDAHEVSRTGCLDASLYGPCMSNAHQLALFNQLLSHI